MKRHLQRALWWFARGVAAVVFSMVYELWVLGWSFVHGSVLPFKRGMKVTVVVHDYVLNGKGDKATAVVRAHVNSRFMYDEIKGDTLWLRSIDKPFKERLVDVRYAERGVTWCRGWTGEPARALRVAKALS